MALKIFDRGRSIDVKLDPVELERGLKLEEQTQVLDRFLEKTDGSYGFQGLLPRGGQITVPKASMKDGISAEQRAARVRARMQNGEPLLLIAYDPETDTPLFAEEDQEAYEDGYICGGCFQYQAVPFAPTCNWLHSPEGSETGCGHRNY